MGPRAGMDVVVRREILSPRRESNPYILIYTSNKSSKINGIIFITVVGEVSIVH
jgi:hypothetical protein